MPLLHDLQVRELAPDERLLDSGYISGDVLAEHAKLGIEVVGPLKQVGGWQHQTVCWLLRTSVLKMSDLLLISACSLSSNIHR